MSFIVHVVATSIGLLVISKLLRGFEVANWFTALVAGFLLGVIHAVLAPFAEKVGVKIGELIASTSFTFTVKMAIAWLLMIAINALLLKLVARFGPGFRISDFSTAMLGSLLLVAFNWLVGEGMDLMQGMQSNSATVLPA
ncbi:MAG: phage holin family protein [Aeoliella sp.]